MTSKLQGRILAAAVFIGFAAVYFSTLYRGFAPGPSAHSVAAALGLESGATQTQVRQIEVQGSGIRSADFIADPKTVSFRTVSGEFRTRHLVWRSAVSFIARSIPFGELAWRLNAFSALLGAITVTLAFALCRGLVLFINFHDSPVSSHGRKVAANGAAIVAALALGLSAPFWIASTRAAPFVFDAFLLVAMAWLLFTATISQRPRDLFIFGAMWGVSLFETDTGILTAIMMLAFAIRAMLVGAVMNLRSWCHLLVGIIAGAVGYITASAILMGASSAAVMLPVMELFTSIKVGLSLARGGVFGDQPKLVAAFFIVLPFAATCALAMWRDAERNAAASGFLLFLLACTSAVALSKTPISPWAVYGASVTAYVPVAVFILAAATLSYLASAGAIMAKGALLSPQRRRSAMRRTAKSEDFDETSVGRVIFWFAIFLAVGCGFFNWREIRDSRDDLIDTTAREFVSRLGKRTWISSTTPALDTLLRIRAWEERRPLHILAHGASGAAAARLRTAITRDEAFRNLDKRLLADSLVSTNIDSFVTTWISIDPEVGGHLVLDAPRPWIDAGRTPIPAAIGYVALEKGETPDWNAIAADHMAFWRAISAADSILGPAAPKHLRAARGELRAYLCQIGEFLADQLVKVKDFPAMRVREILDLVEDVRVEHAPATREEIFY